MNFLICGIVFYFAFCLSPRELSAMPQQISKLVPIEDWIAFKIRVNDVKPLDKFLGKLRATYDFVFPKSENVSNIDEVLSSEEKLENTELEKPEKLILSNSLMTNNIVEIKNETQIDNINDINVELFLNNNSTDTSTKPSSISRISKDNEWLDDVKTSEPLSELEIVDDENIDRSVEIVTQQMGFQLPITVARAFGKWLGSILGFTRGAYLKFTNSTVQNWL